MGCQGIIKTSDFSLVFDIYILFKRKRDLKISLANFEQGLLIYYSVLKQRTE